MTSADADLVEFAAPTLRSVPWIAMIHTVATWLAVIFAAGTGRCRGEHAGADTISSMSSLDIDHWRLIVPVKGQPAAKTRLHPPAGVARADLAHALALDTITAAVTCMPPDHLIVVTSDELTATFVRDQGATVVADPGDGLNPAIRRGIEYVQRVLGTGPTAVLLGDIPTLRPEDLVGALSECSRHARALVPDASGTGTVLLSALSPQDLHPRFGASSARKHGRECVRLDLDLPALRTDVDDDEALRHALAIGVGRHTAAVLHQAPG
ncbi:MAG: 2-phospho-L-lactate guanylyltransferase [Dermatophilaceae bacterium]